MPLGNIYAALVEEDEEFDPVLHARDDLYLVNARAQWSEKDFWTLELEIDNPGGGIFRPGKTRVFISEVVNGVVQHSFTGRLQGWPLGPAGDTVTVNLKCKPKNAEALETLALSMVTDDPYFNFSDPEDKRTADLVLASRSALLHWGRFESGPALVDLLQGDGFIDVADTFIEGSLNLEEPAEHISKVEVTVKAEWQQTLPLVLDLAAALGENGAVGSISTELFDDFPRLGDSIGDWTIIRSQIVPTSPPAGMSQFSRQFQGNSQRNRKISAQDDSQSSGITFRRQFFDVDLIATSVLSANRRETLKFTLSWAGQAIANYDGTNETIDLECRNMRRDVVSGVAPDWQPGVAVPDGQQAYFDGATWLCNTAHVTGASLYADFDKWDPLLFDYSPSGGQAMGRFFGAPIILQGTAPSGQTQLVFRNPTPGYYAFRYALLQARAKMVSGVRVIRASFDVPWEDVWNITGRERIRIEDPGIPGGEMTGKIVDISADFVEGVATITIAAAPGNGGIEPVPFVPNYIERGLFTAGIIEANVINRFDQQEAALALFESPQDYDLMDVVERELATKFQFVLSPTSGTPDMDLTIDVGNLQFDTAKMVDLYA